MAPNERLPRVWVRPVNPEEYQGFEQRSVKPVTRADLDNQFHTTALRAFNLEGTPSQPPQPKCAPAFLGCCQEGGEPSVGGQTTGTRFG